ncbi:FkbM family methyltransferase [Candidatus Omnitrophota bacterium]
MKKILNSLKYMSKHHMFKDSTAIIGAQIASIFISMLLGVVLARTLSLRGMGYYQLILSYLAIANMAALPGMNSMISKGILKDYDPIYYAVLKKSVISTVIFSVLTLALGGIILYLFPSKPVGWIIIVVGVFLPVIGVEKYESFLQGKRNFVLSRKIFVISAFVNLFMVGTVALAFRNIGAVIAALFVSRTAVNLVCLRLVASRVAKHPGDPAFEESLIKQGWRMSFLSVFNIIVGQIDRIILGAINPSILAIYYVGGVLPKKLKDNVKVLLAVPITSWAKLSKEEYFHKIKAHWSKFVLFGTGLAIIIWMVAPSFMILLYGEKYRESIMIARLLSLILPVIFIGTIVFNADIYQGDSVFYRKTTVYTQIFYLGALALLVPRYGIYGVVASFVARGYVQNVFFTSIYLFRNRTLLVSSQGHIKAQDLEDKPRISLKQLLRKTGLFIPVRAVYFSIHNAATKEYKPMHIDYAGQSFTMLGLGGDFAESVKLYGCYEPMMIDKAIETIGTGDIVFDVGSAEGYFSIFASRLNSDPSKVHSFDCSAQRSWAFVKNNRRNMSGRARLVETFVSDRSGEESITIDEYMELNKIEPSAIKIDVEGAEVEVLSGARECLRTCKPHLLIEVHPRFIARKNSRGPEDMVSMLEDAGYSMEMCPNHRGFHRGKVEPWREITEREFLDHCERLIRENGGNFALHCYIKGSGIR